MPEVTWVGVFRTGLVLGSWCVRWCICMCWFPFGLLFDCKQKSQGICCYTTLIQRFMICHWHCQWQCQWQFCSDRFLWSVTDSASGKSVLTDLSWKQGQNFEIPVQMTPWSTQTGSLCHSDQIEFERPLVASLLLLMLLENIHEFIKSSFALVHHVHPIGMQRSGV